MNWQNKIKGNVVNAGDYVGRFISTNGHAQQAFPAMHRAAAVTGMYLGWKGGDKIRDALFAVNKTSEGGYDEIKREDVPFILRPIYHKIGWTPLSDKPSDKWKEILYDFLPAAGAAAGTVAGSMSIFHFNGRAANIAKYKNPNTIVSFVRADELVQHGQSALPLTITSAFGGFSADSLLIFLQGIGINSTYLAKSGNANNILNHSGGNLGPAKALAERIAKVPFYTKSAINSGGKISEDWAKIFVDRFLKPIFGKNLDTLEKETKAHKIVHNTFQEIYDKHSKTLQGENLIKAVSDEMEIKFGVPELTVGEKGKVIYQGIDKFVQESLGLKMEDVTLGNASPTVRAMHEGWVKFTGLGKSTSAASNQERLVKQRNQIHNHTGVS